MSIESETGKESFLDKMKLCILPTKFIEKDPKYCRFCKIQRNSKNLIIAQDENVFIIKSLKQNKCKGHFLCLPKTHIHDVNYLTSQEDLELLGAMEKLLQNYLSTEFPEENFRYGFHVPPVNSVPHLHLHGFVLPFKHAYHDKILYGTFLTPVKDIEKLIQMRIAKNNN